MRNTIETAHSFLQKFDPSVRLHIGPHPGVPSAVAAAIDGNIYLHPRAMNLSPAEFHHLLAHELAHIWQQQLGIVQVTTEWSGIPGNDEARHEKAANCIAAQLADPRCSIVPKPVRTMKFPMVLQCMIHVDDKVCKAANDLALTNQLLLEMIPNGESWMRSVIAAPVVYRFPNQYALLAAIQEGLHGSPHIRLPKLGFWFHPYAIQPFSFGEIDYILSTERSPEKNNIGLMRVNRILNSHELWTESEFVMASDHLTLLGVENAAIFGSMSLADRIALFRLFNEASSENSFVPWLQTEAATFAVEHAQNALEFRDLYLFFLSLVGPSPAERDTVKRSRFAITMMEAWTELLYDQLWRPILQHTTTPSEILQILRERAREGQHPGFPRLSAALSFVAQHVDLQGSTGSTLQSIVHGSMERLRHIWLDQAPAEMRYTQDGRYQRYLYDDGVRTAELWCDQDGTLSIGRVARKSTLTGDVAVLPSDPSLGP